MGRSERVDIVIVWTALRLQFAEIECLLGISQRAVVRRADLLRYQCRVLNVVRPVQLTQGKRFVPDMPQLAASLEPSCYKRTHAIIASIHL